MKKTIVAILALAGAAGSANAQGDLVFTDTVNQLSTTSQNHVKWYQAGSNSVSTIFSYNNVVDGGNSNRPSVRLSDLTFGPGGSIFVGNGPSQVGTGQTVGQIYRIDNPFGAASSTTVASGGDLQNPIGLQWDTRTQRLVYTNNPNLTPGPAKGVYTMDAGGTITRLRADESNLSPLPINQNNAFLVPSPQGGDDYYVVSTNGGRFLVPQGALPANRNWASRVTRLSFPTAGLDAGSMSNTIDFSDIGPVNGNPLPAPFPANTFNPFGDGTLPTVLTDVRGIAASNSGSLYVTDQLTGGIYEIFLNGAGNYNGIRTVITGLSGPEAIAYDYTNNTLVFAEHGNARIARINLDGSGLSTVVSDVFVRGIRIVPTPAGVAIVGLGGLVALRRRRA